MKKTPIAAFVSHVLWQNPPCLSASRMNCHTRNVHSIMLSDVPGARIRLFIAIPEHDLYRNFPGAVQNYAGRPEANTEMSVGFHAHHCDLTLACVYGTFLNWRVSTDGVQIPVHVFHYDSALNGGSGKFINRGGDCLNSESTQFVRAGEFVHLDASDIHTVAVDRGEMAAWLVFEGKEDADYLPRPYSNADLEQHDPTGLYVPMSEGDIRNLLRMVDLL